VQEASKWPKKLAAAGVIILLISIAVLVSNIDEFEEATDPSHNSLLVLDGSESEEINLSKESSYLLFRLTNTDHNCTIVELATDTDVTIGSPGWVQSPREGKEGEFYYPVGTFIPDESGLHIIENNAEEGEILWILDETDVEYSIVLTISASCCGIFCGSGLIPLAFILWRNGKRNVGKAGLVMQTADGMLVPIAPADGTMQQRIPTTDEIWRSVHGGEVLNLSVGEPEEPEVPAPFADRPDRSGEISRAIDEVESVEETVSESTSVKSDVSQKGWKSWDEG
tara:strand:+ start:702 stop:1547 length:846 start_codon:yes stop_codon:yes gene_type:complete